MSETREFYFTTREAQIIFGRSDENLRYLERRLSVNLLGRGNQLKIRGEPEKVDQTCKVLSKLKELVAHQEELDQLKLAHILAQTEMKAEIHRQIPEKLLPGQIQVYSRRTMVVSQSPKQKAYVQAIRNYDLTVAIGPAGTGKTYLAVACAIEAVKQGSYQKIVLTRPALEAGERLGFLPGDLEEKIKPYLQPIYDALYDLMKYEELKRWTERRIIEIIPLAYMRGRTLREAFVILDEAQNTTAGQLQMFLTRLGPQSRAVITGDITQIDLPLTRDTSGLVEIQSVLKGIPGIKFIYFTQRDVVRHPLVKKIILAYQRHREKNVPRYHSIPPEKN
ncbi:MAG: PhoH family protein [Candidatus Omnitrophica bacterium]|nr:PhoH family protein [Candidatus Omnitrophota bacterium]